MIINTNTGSLSKKIDNCEAICKANYADVACISERWLKEDIPNAGIKISGFIPGRNDCPGIKKGDGVVCYVKETLQFNKWNILQDEEIECVCITIGPRRLPHEVSNITFGVLYHPECASNSTTLDYLNRSLDTIL